MVNGILSNKELCFDLPACTSLVSSQSHLDGLGNEAVLMPTSYIKHCHEMLVVFTLCIHETVVLTDLLELRVLKLRDINSTNRHYLQHCLYTARFLYRIFEFWERGEEAI